MAFKKRHEDVPQKPRKKHEEEHGEEEGDDEGIWLTSYADLMTLLAGFFIMMFALSNMEEPQYEEVKEEMSKMFGGDYESESKKLARFATQVVEEMGVEQQISLKPDLGGVKVIVQSKLFFDAANADMHDEGSQIIVDLIEKIKEREDLEKTSYKIVVEGHTDSQPIIKGGYPSNWELSSARASKVVRMFLDRGFNRNNVMAIGYAHTRPEVPNRMPSGKWNPEIFRNRRVVIRLLGAHTESIPWNSDKFEDSKKNQLNKTVQGDNNPNKS